MEEQAEEMIYKLRTYGVGWKITPENLPYFTIPYGIIAFPLSGWDDCEEE